MDDLLSLLRGAWDRLGPVLAGDPFELKRRLARRRLKMMRRPPRAWCLGVRANDARINPATALIVPESAVYPGPAETRTALHRRYEVTLDATLVRRLCRPIRSPGVGLEQIALAKELGRRQQNLHSSAKRGAFKVHRVYGLSGKLCDVPLLGREGLIDPSANMHQYPDPLWGMEAVYVCEHVPDELCQTLERVPMFRQRDDQRSMNDPGLQFCGWKWVCPGCGQTKRTLFYPLPAIYGVQLLKRAPEDELDWLSKPLPAFACARCHDVLYFTRINADAWNHLIAHLSGGLLYGHEVTRPAWFQFERKKAFRPVVNRAPSKRRAEVWAGLQAGLSYSQISRSLGVHKSTVNMHARKLDGIEGADRREERQRLRCDDARV